MPSFLVLDQPSQAFFQPDQSSTYINDQDRHDALAQFELIHGVVSGLRSASR